MDPRRPGLTMFHRVLLAPHFPPRQHLFLPQRPSYTPTHRPIHPAILSRAQVQREVFKKSARPHIIFVKLPAQRSILPLSKHQPVPPSPLSRHQRHLLPVHPPLNPPPELANLPPTAKHPTPLLWWVTYHNTLSMAPSSPLSKLYVRMFPALVAQRPVVTVLSTFRMLIISKYHLLPLFNRAYQFS